MPLAGIEWVGKKKKGLSSSFNETRFVMSRSTAVICPLYINRFSASKAVSQNCGGMRRGERSHHDSAYGTVGRCVEMLKCLRLRLL